MLPDPGPPVLRPHPTVRPRHQHAAPDWCRNSCYHHERAW